MISLILEITPVPAARPRVSRFNTYYPEKYSNFRSRCALLLRAGYRGNILKGPLSVDVIFNLKRPKRPANAYPNGDIDNFLKSILDAANGILWVDDLQVVEVRARKQYGEPNITVMVKEISEE